MPDPAPLDADTIDAIVEEAWARLERGESVDEESAIRAHPALAEDLRQRFEVLRRVHRAFEATSGGAGAPASRSLAGSCVGPYRLEAELGAGGMGTVYRASVERRVPGLTPGERVAVKVVHPHLLGRDGFFRRFLREVEIGRRVRHENVVRTLDADAVQDGGTHLHFLVLEFVEGQTLRSLLREVERVPEELCRHVGREVAKALVAIHEAGAVHRDLKPENVLITAANVVKVMDLGVARLSAEAVGVSQTGAFVGSVRYAAPEQFRGGAAVVDGRADLYALGLTLYELATGRHPFPGDDFHVVLRQQMTETPRPAGEVNPQLSPFFEEFLRTLLQKDPERRFHSAEVVLSTLVEGERSVWWHERAIRVRAETRRPLRRIRIPRETALHGREAELTRLRAVYALAKAGDGQVVLVEGEAGIGKSRLADEFVGLLQREGEDVHFLFGSYPPGGAATASGAFSTAYREQFGEETLEEALREALQATPLLVQAFAALLRGDAAPTGVEPLTKDSLQTVFIHATRSLAKERTTIVLIDDLHFAPEEGRGLFASLALATPGHRILLVGTARPGLPQDWMVNVERSARVTRLPLARLGPKDLVRLLADTLKSDRLAEELSGRIAVKSDGNPFFVFEILRGLKERQFLAQSPDGTWVTTQILRDIEVPSTIQDLVNARVADLAADERNLLDVASCLGFEFDPFLVGDVLGLERIPLLRTLGQIERRHRLVRSAGVRFVFDHHQVQEALYGSLSELLRREYHASLGAAIEARAGAAAHEPGTIDGAISVELVEHFLMGARGDSALRHLDAALAHLTRGCLSDQVVRLAERALDVPNLLVGAHRARVLLQVCDSLWFLGPRERHAACAREADRLAGEVADDELRTETAMAVGTALWLENRHAEAEVAHRRALDLARVCGNPVLLLRANGNLGAVLISQRRFADGREHCERALVIAREIGDRKREATLTGNLGVLCFELGRLGEAQDCFDRSLAIHRAIGHRNGEGHALGNLGGILLERGRLPEAKEHLARAITILGAIGNRVDVAVALVNLGKLSIDETDAERSEDHFLRALSIYREIGDRRGESIACLNLGSLRAAAGDPGSGHKSLTMARDLAREVGVPDIELLSRCELALLPGGDAADALAAFAEHGEVVASQDRCAARLLLWRATGDRTHLVRAKRLLDEAVAHEDEESRSLMLTSLRVNREILAACKAEGIE